MILFQMKENQLLNYCYFSILGHSDKQNDENDDGYDYDNDNDDEGKHNEH